MKPWHYAGLGFVAGAGLSVLLFLLARKKLMTSLRGDKPLPNGMDAKLEAFSYDLINDMMQ